MSYLADVLCRYPENFRVDYALSREMNNKSGGKMYIQDKMEEYADELFDLLDNGADIYFCGSRVRTPQPRDLRPCRDLLHISEQPL